jgi:hypothetical protein
MMDDGRNWPTHPRIGRASFHVAGRMCRSANLIRTDSNSS